LETRQSFSEFAGNLWALEQIPDLPADVRAEVTQLWQQMRDDLFALPAETTRPLSKEYRRDLKQNESVIALIASTRTTPSEKLEYCKALADDLRLKRRYAEANKGAPFGVIEVRVHTVNGGREVEG